MTQSGRYTASVIVWNYAALAALGVVDNLPVSAVTGGQGLGSQPRGRNGGIQDKVGSRRVK